jgi:ankyrin repeat protein
MKGPFRNTMFLFLCLSVFIFPLCGQSDDETSLNALDANGETVLFVAAKYRDVEQVNFLLGKGADVNQQGGTGETALMAVCSRRWGIWDIEKEREIIRLLLDSGADLNLLDREGGTALMKIYRKEFAELFLRIGADPCIKDHRGQTVLFRWVGFLDEPLFDRLIEKGVDPNTHDERGRTALHHYLLEVEERNRSGYRYGDYESITAMFLAAGTRPAETDNAGDSALSTAIRLSNMHGEMIPLKNLLLEYADDDEIKLAEAMASKIVAQEKRDNLRSGWAYYFPPIMGALSFPLLIGGLSIGMREGVYKDNPSNNFMGSINGVLNITMGGMTLGALLFFPLVYGGGEWGIIFPIVGGFAGGILGLAVGTILTAAQPSIGKTVKDNAVLYYLPTAVSALVATLVIVKLRY